MSAENAVDFCLKIICACWPFVLVLGIGIACLVSPMRRRRIFGGMPLCVTALVLILLGLGAMVRRGGVLLPLTLLSGEENDEIEWAAERIDKRWSVRQTIGCLEDVVAGGGPFSRPEKEQLAVLLSRLLARKGKNGEIPEGVRFANPAEFVSNVHPTLYYEYGYAEGIRTFREGNGFLTGINAGALYRFFLERDSGGQSLFAPFPMKNVGAIDRQDGIYLSWSLRNQSGRTQIVELRPAGMSAGFRLLFWRSEDDSLRIPDCRAFQDLPKDGDAVTVPHGTVLWVKAELDKCRFDGAFTNIVVFAMADGVTNALSVCGDAG